MSRLTAAAAGVALVLAVLTAGCGSAWDQEHNHNTPTGPYVAPANVVIEFPYNFDNVARACVDGDGLYMPYTGKTVFVVANDPACKGSR